MRLVRPALLILALITLNACQTAEQQAAAPAMSSTELAALKHKWEGRWSGGWGGSCKSAIEVSDVRGSTARAVYSYANCGESGYGNYSDSSADISGDTLKVDVGWANVTYVMVDPNTLKGQFSLRGRTSRGTFRREGAQMSSAAPAPKPAAAVATATPTCAGKTFDHVLAFQYEESRKTGCVGWNQGAATCFYRDNWDTGRGSDRVACSESGGELKVAWFDYPGSKGRTPNARLRATFHGIAPGSGCFRAMDWVWKDGAQQSAGTGFPYGASKCS